MITFTCYVENRSTGYISREDIITALDAATAEKMYYESHPDTGFEGDECIVTPL